MKIGNASGVLGMLTEPILSKKRAILEKKSYSLFLKKTYGKANLIIDKIEVLGADKSSADVEIDFNDGGSHLRTKYILKKDNGIWKISDERTDL
jgi:hypothetical protein